MEPGQSATAYKAEFLARVKAARVARFKAQEDLCEVLGIKQATYHKYEVRSLMPHPLIPRFCKACGVSTDWLFGLKGMAGPAWKAVYPNDPKEKDRRKQLVQRGRQR